MLLNNLFHISASQQRDNKMPNANSSYPQTFVNSFSRLSVAAKLVLEKCYRCLLRYRSGNVAVCGTTEQRICIH